MLVILLHKNTIGQRFLSDKSLRLAPACVGKVIIRTRNRIDGKRENYHERWDFLRCNRAKSLLSVSMLVDDKQFGTLRMLRMELKEKNKLDDLRSATDKLFRM